MSTYSGKIKAIKARSRSKRLREIGGTASTVASSREVVAAPSVDLSRYVLKAAFDDLFEKVNLGTDAAPKWAIKAKYNFYTVGWLSFRGANDGSGGSASAGAANLADLKDVSLGSLVAGQALVWNGAKWVNSTIATSGLDELSLANYLSSHNYATQQWVTAQGFLKQHQSLADYLKIDGSNGTAAGVTALIKHLDDATADILDTTKLVTSDTLGDNAASRMYHRRPAIALWNYIKSKSNALYVTAIGTSGNNLTYIKGGITNNITVPYAAKTRLLEEAYGLARGSYDALQERPDELPAGLRVKFKGYPGAGVGPESYWNTVLDITAVSGGSVTGAGYRTQFLFSNSLNESDGTFWVRNGIDATWNSWQQVFTTGNYQGLLANTFYNKTEVDAKLDKKLDKAAFDDLLEKVNLGTDAAPKWAIKAKYNFYTVGWLSFRGSNDGSGGSAVAGAANLSDLKDVSLGSLVAGQALVWNGAKWVNSTIATSGLDEASLSNYLSSHGYATQQWANDRYYTKTEVDAKNFIKDIGDGRSLMFNYSANALGYDNFTWVAVWNGNTLQCCNKSLFATASALTSGLAGKVNKAGDTMTGHLTMLAKDVYLKNNTDNSQYVCYGFKNTANAVIAQVGYHNTAKRVIINPVGSDEPWMDAVGKYNLIVGNNELKYNTYSLWHSGNDGHNSGLDADTVDGVHASSFLYYKGAVSSATTAIAGVGLYGWSTATSSNFNGFSHGYGDSIVFQGLTTWYNRLDFCTNGQIDFWHAINPSSLTGSMSKVGTLAFLHSTVANADKLGGKAASQYVTTDTVQEITGRKTIRGASLKLLCSSTSNAANRHSAGVLAFQEHAYDDQFGIWGYFGGTGASQKLFIGGSGAGTSLANDQNGTTLTPYLTIEHTTGNLTVLGKIIKSGGTAAQFLMADGSVVTKKTATAPCDLGWVNNDTGNSSVPTIAVLAYWDGCYKGTGSNLRYCDRGRFGTMATASASDYLARSGGSMTNTNVVTNLNADLLDGYHVSQLARLMAANASAGAYNLPVYVNGGVVNAVSSVGEAFLSWGGQSLTGNFSPVDGAMMSHLGANRFAFLKPAGTTFQYSTNGGATWSDYGLSNTQKSGFFDAGVQQALQAGKAANGTATASHQLRITIATSAAGVYTDINKFAINFATQGCSGTTVTIEKALESTPDSWVTVASNVPLAGWTAWNVVNVPAFRTYGNVTTTQYGRIRFTFKCTGVSSDKSPFVVLCIMAYGGFGWTTPSYMAATGHLYKYDGNQNAYFPGYVRLNNDGHDVGTTWNNGAGQLGIALVNNANQTPLLVAHRYGAASDVTGANRLFALELLNNGAEMHFVFGGSTKFSMTSAGVFFANGGIWTNGYMSFKGQDTSSDARQKRILSDIHVPLATIAKAPNIVFSWLDTGKLDMGSIAQYWQEHLPLSVYVRPNGYFGMDYSKVALACVISMASELLGVKDDVSKLKRELRQLKHENQQLKQQIITLERRIA